MFDDFTDFVILHHLLTDNDKAFEAFIDKQLIGA